MENEALSISHQAGQVLGRALIGSLIQAIILRLAARWVAKVDVPFGRAYGLTFLIMVTVGMGNTFLSHGLLSAGVQPLVVIITTIAAAIVLTLGLATGVYGTAIRHEGGDAIGLGQGFLTALMQVGIGIALVLGIFAIILGAALIF